MDEERRNGLHQALWDDQGKARIGVQTGTGTALLLTKSSGTRGAENTEHIKKERSCLYCGISSQRNLAIDKTLSGSRTINLETQPKFRPFAIHREEGVENAGGLAAEVAGNFWTLRSFWQKNNIPKKEYQPPPSVLENDQLSSDDDQRENNCKERKTCQPNARYQSEERRLSEIMPRSRICWFFFSFHQHCDWQNRPSEETDQWNDRVERNRQGYLYEVHSSVSFGFRCHYRGNLGRHCHWLRFCW